VQYVAVASRGNFEFDFPRGDTLWVFSLDGTIDPAAVPPTPKSIVESAALAVSIPRIVDFSFQPGWILVPPGTTLTWTNVGPSPHSATSTTGLWDTGNLQAGESASFTFAQPGSYDYFCRPHPFMVGKVIAATNAAPAVPGPPEHGPSDAPRPAPSPSPPP
jgi:plastocyanin